MTIIGILAATVTLAVSDAGQRQRVQAEAERMALAIELARTEALTRNEVWGLSVEPTGYAFQTYDPDADAWTAVEDAPFLPRNLEPGLMIETRTDTLGRAVRESEEPTRPVPPDDGGRGGEPRIAILPGGEVTPFQIIVSSGDLPAWSARSDGLARVTATLDNVVNSDPDDGP